MEGGTWPPKAALKRLAARAVKAAVAVLNEAAGVSDLSADPFPPGFAKAAPGTQGGGAPELSIVFTDDAAIGKLNAAFRGMDKPTNVLSFPQSAAAQGPAAGHGEGPRAAPGPSGMLLGDVILAAETVRKEAALADKPLEDHMAHLIIHGFLHLLGCDHEAEGDAEKMEQLERLALTKMGISDPYAAADVR